MKCIVALSTDRDTEAAQASVLGRLAGGLDGGPADLGVVFASEHHAEALGRIARELRSRGLCRHVLGCTGESIVGEDREVEEGPALSLWAIRLPDARLRPARLTFDGSGFLGREALASPVPPATVLLLGDPFTFPADHWLRSMNEASPGVRIVGGMASAGHSPGTNRLVLDDETFEDGAVALAIDGPVRIRTIVSQGCRPIGRPLIVTRVDRNIIRELGRIPAIEVFQEICDGLDEADRARVRRGLHIGRVINEYQETFRRGDFLVRNVLGGDDSGGIAINDLVRVGQTVQFHVRDAETAAEDLRNLLEAGGEGQDGGSARGALLFTCNGRGSRLFPGPNHDVGLVREVLGPIPVAGFFAMGEVGPVGGQNFLHGFTASLALFEETA